VFQSSRITADNPQGDYEIFSMNPDGTEVKQLTFNNRDDRDPAFARLGARIAFVSNRDGNYEIYTMKPNGTGQANRSNAPDAIDVATDWQPTIKLTLLQ
jgi:Tol biopolymer transport system component